MAKVIAGTNDFARPVIVTVGSKLDGPYCSSGLIYKEQLIGRLPDHIKLNIEGSSFGNPGAAGSGSDFRNHLGDWVLGFGRNIGVTTNCGAEAWPLRDDLSIVVANNFCSLIIEFDSRAKLNLIANESSNNHLLSHLICD
ncbi:hypothetical protein ACH5RR_038729 [Cinchona calisaya]|uniref:RNase H type-1 domain-containing protein n=1 Tax=Cinchona calisaya TaxID=153742 RepID=A0ABD2XXY6_9GENT